MNSRVPEASQKARGWPKQANVLSNALRRLSPNLRAIGIEVIFSQTGGKGSRRLVKIEKVDEPIDATDATDASRYENVTSGTSAPSTPTPSKTDVPSTPPPTGTDAAQSWSVDGVDGVDESGSFSIDDFAGLIASWENLVRPELELRPGVTVADLPKWLDSQPTQDSVDRVKEILSRMEKS